MHFVRVSFPSPRSTTIACGAFWLTIILIFSLAATGCAKASKTAARGGAGPAPVLVGKVQRKVVPLTVSAVGVVEPIHTAALRSQVTGTLVKIAFTEGQEVKAGDLLFELDSRPFRNALNAAEADLQRLRAQLENAHLQVTRYTALNDQEIVTSEQFQSVQVAERVLAGQVVVAENAVATARLQLEFCSIRAPFAGRTGNLGVHEGDLVRASDANVSLVTIHELDPIYVTFGVPQQNLAVLVKYLSAGKISVAAAPAGSEEMTEHGELAFIDNAVETTTGTLKLKARFQNEAHRLWPGQFASVNVTLASPDVLTVPTRAVQTNQKGQHVLVVAANHTAELRDVEIERALNGDSVVTKGLTEGETVIVDGQIRVVPGKPVEVKAPLAPGTDPAALVKTRPHVAEKPKAS